MMSDPPESAANGGRAAFPDTRWTLLQAVRSGGQERSDALEEICQRYWFPLYAWLRRSGQSHPDAEDLVQSFLSRLVSGDALDSLEQQGGRLRSWMLTLLRNHTVSAWRHEHTARRGGRLPPLESADERYTSIPDTASGPDALFDRQWALQVLEAAISALRQHYARGGREEVFTALRPALLQTGGHVNFSALAGTLGMSEGQARVTAFRMRKHLRQLIEAEILRISGTESSAREELETFRRALVAG